MGRLRTFLARERTITREQPYYDTERHKLVLRVIDALADKEVERPVGGQDDWTQTYNWTLTVQHRDAGAGNWMVEGRFFFWDLPRCIQFSVP